MHADYDGRRIVGIDLHRRRSVIVRMSEAGQRLEAVRIDNDPVALAREVAKAGEAPEVVLEASYGWYWAVDALQAAGDAFTFEIDVLAKRTGAQFSAHS